MSFYTYFIALLALGAVEAAPTATVATSISTQETCITRLRPAPTSISPLPTSTRTKVQTRSKTVTVIGQTSEAMKTVTPKAVTSTVSETLSDVSHPTVSASSTTVYVTVTESGDTAGETCASTTTVTADATSTVYTGTYSANKAKRTSVTQKDAFVKKSKTSLANAVIHQYGEPLSKLSRKAFEVDCTERLTTYLIATTTLSAAVKTTTVTASTPTIYITRTMSAASTSESSAPPKVTFTSTLTQQASMNSSATLICTVTSGTPAATTTQHIKCAPTNLIGTANGYGIAQTQGHANETEGLTDGRDPSACCQTCVDTEGCAASSDDQGAGNCFLWYTTSPTCGLGFQYTDAGQKLAPRSGFLVQSGCGSIEVIPASP